MHLIVFAGDGPVAEYAVAALVRQQIPFELCQYGRTKVRGVPGYPGPILNCITDFAQVEQLLKRDKNTHVLVVGTAYIPTVIRNPDFTRAIIKKGSRRDDLLVTLQDHIQACGCQLASIFAFAPELGVPAGLLSTTPIPDTVRLEISTVQSHLADPQHSASTGRKEIVTDGTGQIVFQGGKGGTDPLLIRMAKIPKGHSSDKRILYKFPQSRSDYRMDTPVIGLDTIRLMIPAQVDGVIMKSTCTIFMDKAAAIQLADQHSLFVYAT